MQRGGGSGPGRRPLAAVPRHGHRIARRSVLSLARLARGGRDPELRPGTRRPALCRRRTSGRTCGERRDGAARTVLFAPDSFKGSLTSVAGRAGAGGWLAPRPPGRHGPALPAGRRRRGHARGDRRGRRLGVADGRGPRPARPRDPGALAAFERRRAGPWSRWPRRPACRGVAPGERDAVAATSVGTGEAIRAAIDAGVRPRSCWGSAAAPRPTAARACCAGLGADGRSRRAARRSDRPRPAARRRRPGGRLRRGEPAARADRRRRGLRPAEGRVGGGRRRARSPARLLRRRARGERRSRESATRRGRGGRRRRVRPAGDRRTGSARSPCGRASSW